MNQQQQVQHNQDYMQMNFGQGGGYVYNSQERQPNSGQMNGQQKIVKHKIIENKKVNIQNTKMTQSLQQAKNQKVDKNKQRNQSIGSVISDKSIGFPNHRNSLDESVSNNSVVNMQN